LLLSANLGYTNGIIIIIIIIIIIFALGSKNLIIIIIIIVTNFKRNTNRDLYMPYSRSVADPEFYNGGRIGGRTPSWLLVI